MIDIFLSYTHIDRPRARPIVELLESEGWTVWWDRGIEPGMAWQPELEIELANCRAVIVLLSEHAVAAYLMDQVAMVEQRVSPRIDIANYRIELADLEKVAQLRFPKLLHAATAL